MSRQRQCPFGADPTQRWSGGYIASLEARTVREHRPGSAALWLRAPYAVVDGEDVSTTAKFLAAVDAANGIAAPVDPAAMTFPDVDLGVHLIRRPVSSWTGLDTHVSIGGTGVGLTESALHDEAGYLGRVARSLTVRPRPASG